MKATVKVQMMAADPLHIALIMPRDMPKPDLDTAFLVDALEGRRHRHNTLPWDAQDDWSQFNLIVLWRREPDY